MRSIRHPGIGGFGTGAAVATMPMLLIVLIPATSFRAARSRDFRYRRSRDQIDGKLIRGLEPADQGTQDREAYLARSRDHAPSDLGIGACRIKRAEAAADFESELDHALVQRFPTLSAAPLPFHLHWLGVDFLAANSEAPVVHQSLQTVT